MFRSIQITCGSHRRKFPFNVTARRLTPPNSPFRTMPSVLASQQSEVMLNVSQGEHSPLVASPPLESIVQMNFLSLGERVQESLPQEVAGSGPSQDPQMSSQGEVSPAQSARQTRDEDDLHTNTSPTKSRRAAVETTRPDESKIPDRSNKPAISATTHSGRVNAFDGLIANGAKLRVVPDRQPMSGNALVTTDRQYTLDEQVGTS